MSDIFDSVERIWDRMKAQHLPLPTIAAIDPAQCWPTGVAGVPIVSDETYFTLRINEMFLKDNQQWFATFDPLVLVVAQFVYNGRRITVPSVVGPNLIAKFATGDKAKFGVTMFDTLVAGPYPYRGGDVDLSISFYRVQRQNNAKALIDMVERISSLVGGVGHLDVAAKVAAAVLEGVEGILGLSGTVMLAGHRVVLGTSAFDPFSTGYYGLFLPPVPVSINTLSVRDRRLLKSGDGKADGMIAYRDSDFAMLGVSGSDQRGNESLLPFYALKLRALVALREGKAGLARARANLMSAYQAMRESPDVTANDARRILDSWIDEFNKDHAWFEKANALSTGIKDETISDLDAELNSVLKRIED